MSIVDPNQAVICHRCFSLANELVWTIELQVERIQDQVLRERELSRSSWADFHFLISAMDRLERVVGVILTSIDAPSLENAHLRFKAKFPDLRAKRNIWQHVDDYLQGKGKDRSVNPDSLFTGIFSAKTFNWVGQDVPIDAVIPACAEMISAINQLKRDMK